MPRERPHIYDRRPQDLPLLKQDFNFTPAAASNWQCRLRGLSPFRPGMKKGIRSTRDQCKGLHVYIDRSMPLQPAPSSRTLKSGSSCVQRSCHIIFAKLHVSQQDSG